MGPANRAKGPRNSYCVVPQKDSTYGVKFTDGVSVPTTIRSFATQTGANAWITEQSQINLREAADSLGEAAGAELKKRAK